MVQNNHHLRTLNLASLRRIENGGVRINSNPNLCLVDTIAVERYLVNSRLLRVGGLGQDCTGEFHNGIRAESRGTGGGGGGGGGSRGVSTVSIETPFELV